MQLIPISQLKQLHSNYHNKALPYNLFSYLSIQYINTLIHFFNYILYILTVSIFTPYYCIYHNLYSNIWFIYCNLEELLDVETTLLTSKLTNLFTKSSHTSYRITVNIMYHKNQNQCQPAPKMELREKIFI